MGPLNVLRSSVLDTGVIQRPTGVDASRLRTFDGISKAARLCPTHWVPSEVRKHAGSATACRLIMPSLANTKFDVARIMPSEYSVGVVDFHKES
jgi:hypothetical protein